MVMVSANDGYYVEA